MFNSKKMFKKQVNELVRYLWKKSHTKLIAFVINFLNYLNKHKAQEHGWKEMQNEFNVNKRQHEKIIHNKIKKQKPIKSHKKKKETHNNTFWNRRNVSNPKHPGISYCFFFLPK